MLKGAEYVDSILAQKIVSLQRQLQKIQQSKRQIVNNSALQKSTKNKLLTFQSECQQNLQNLLSGQRDKLAEYLDKQTTVITKDNRKSQIHQHKNSFTLNQSTRIDLSIDDSKSFQATRKSETFTKSINSFNFRPQNSQKCTTSRFGDKYRFKLKRLNNKVSQQRKLINILVLWVKIYCEREETYMKGNAHFLSEQHRKIKQQNITLNEKCLKLQHEIQRIKNEFKRGSQRALEGHRKRQQIREQNKGFELQRKQLINTVRSLQKTRNKQ